MFLKNYFLIITLFISCNFFAQQGDKNDFYVRAAFNYGFILQQHNNIGDLVHGNIGGFELNYVKPTTGNRLWHYENNFAEKGVGFSFFDLHNPKQLGNLYAVYGFYDIPLKEKHKPFRLYMRLSPGLAYAPVHYDPIENHKNNVISSSVSAYVNFKWYYRWNITSRLRWEGGLNFSHASNGRFKVPNLGLNMVTLNTGFVYKFLTKEKTAPAKIDSSTIVNSKHEIIVWGAVGINEIEPAGGKKYLNQSYSATFYRNVRNTHKFGGGIDVYYCSSNLEEFRRNNTALSSNLQNIQVAAKIAYAYNIGRVSLPVEMGYCFFSKYKDDGVIVQRIGVRYFFKNNMIALVSLKTHWAVASCFEFGLGYKVPVKKKLNT